jgi:myo-inositol-1(or 4)-monophosphatase
LALIAAGYAKTTFSLGPKNEWDIAAGVLLVEEAGGQVTEKAGENFTFNRKNTLVNGIIVSTAGDYQKVRSLTLHQVYTRFNGRDRSLRPWL